MKKILYLSVLFSLLFVSCEYEIDYNGELAEDKFVVAAFIEEDSVINFSISHSAKPGTFWEFTTAPYLESPEVNLYVNDEWKEKLTYKYKTKSFASIYKPKHNDKISLTLENAKYGKAEGSTILNLTNPVVDSISAHITTINEEDRLVLYLEIEDDGGENYYMLSPELTYGLIDVDIAYAEVLQESHEGVFFENSAVTSMIGNRGYNEFGVFSNKKFCHQKYVIKLSYYLNRWFDDLFETEDKDFADDETELELKGFIVLSKIDKNAYEYLYTLGNVLNSSIINTSPMHIKNSLDNAYGFIGCKKSVKFDINNILQTQTEK